MESLLLALFSVAIFFLIIGLAFYIAIAIFLNKFNKLVYGKGTAMAWIPVFNVYLLGKLTVNKLVGWILVICSFLTGTYTTTVNGVETTHTILPKGISSVVSTIYGLAVLGLFIYAIIKYNKLKKEGKVSEQITSQQYTQSTINQQNVPQQPIQQSIQQPIINQQQPQAQQGVVNNQPTNQNPTNTNNY